MSKLLHDYADKKYVPRGLTRQDKAYATNPAMMQCLFLDGTVKSEAEDALEQLAILYSIDVEKDLAHKFRMNQVDQIKPIRVDWIKDMTGDSDIPDNSVYYTTDNNAKPTVYALQALQHEMYFRLRANFGRLLGGDLKGKVMHRIREAEKAKTGLTSDNRHEAEHRIKWKEIVDIVVSLCVPNTGGYYHRNAWQLQRAENQSLDQWYSSVVAAITERDQKFGAWSGKELQDWVACFVRWMPNEERAKLRDRTKHHRKNIYTLTWPKIERAMKSINPIDFRPFRRSRVPRALEQTLISASQLTMKNKEIKRLTHENRQLREQLAKTKRAQPPRLTTKPRLLTTRDTTVNGDAPRRPPKSDTICHKCLKDKIGKQYHDADMCTAEWRAHVLDARKRNHEKQLARNRSTNKSVAKSVSRSDTDNSDWKTTPCPSCVAEGLTGRLATHPRHDLCIRLIMNERGIMDKAKRAKILKDFFAARKARTPFPLVEEYKRSRKRKPDDTGSAPPPRKRVDEKTNNSGSITDPNDPYGLGLNPIPDCKAYIPTPPASAEEDE